MYTNLSITLLLLLVGPSLFFADWAFPTPISHHQLTASPLFVASLNRKINIREKRNVSSKATICIPVYKVKHSLYAPSRMYCVEYINTLGWNKVSRKISVDVENRPSSEVCWKICGDICSDPMVLLPRNITHQVINCYSDSLGGLLEYGGNRSGISMYHPPPPNDPRVKIVRKASYGWKNNTLSHQNTEDR